MNVQSHFNLDECYTRVLCKNIIGLSKGKHLKIRKIWYLLCVIHEKRWPNFDFFYKLLPYIMQILICLSWKHIEIHSSKYQLCWPRESKNQQWLKLSISKLLSSAVLNFIECHKYAYTVCNTRYLLVNQVNIIFIEYNVRVHQ